MLLGQRTGRAIRVGQAVRAKLIGVHLDRLEIDLELTQDAASPESGEAAPLSRKERRAVEESRKATRAREKRIASKSSGGSKSGSRSSGARRSSGTGGGKASGRPAGRKKGEVRGTKRER